MRGFLRLSKRSRILVVIAAVLVLLGGVAFVLTTTGKQPLSAPEIGYPMLFGVHEQYQSGPNQTTPEETKKRYPSLMATREFKAGEIKPQNLIPSLKNLCGKVWDDGLLCVVSFKFSRAEVANGKWQPFIEQAVKWMKDNKKTAQTVLIPWHEPENDFDTGREFVTYFNQVHDWVKQADPKLLTSHAAMAYQYRDNGKIGTDAKALEWKTKADIQSIDIYSGQSFPLNMTMPTNSAFKRWKRTVAGTQPWAVSERGWITGKYGDRVERANAIRAEFDWLVSLPIEELPVFYIVWSTEGTEGNENIILGDPGRKAVNEGFARIAERLTEEPLPEPAPSEPTIDCPTCKGTGKVPASWSVTTTITAGK